MKILVILIIISNYCFTQTDSTLQIDEELGFQCFAQPDSLPQLIGGLDSLRSRLDYPVEAIQNRIEGNVYVILTIDTSGIVLNPKVLKSLGYGCDEEAIRLVITSKFLPAVDKGEKVKCQIMIPINFRLPDK